MNKNETIKKGTINMKKLTALFLGLAMVLSLAACGTSISDETSAPETSTPSASSEAQEPSVAPESTESTGEHGRTFFPAGNGRSDRQNPGSLLFGYRKHGAGGKLYCQYYRWRFI